jgi:PD-(D/E)XK endonuclease
MLKQKNTRRQGDVGVAMAIAFFTKRGDIVSIPLGEPPDYDLVVDIGGVLKRVQVKTTRRERKSGKFEVQLRTTGGNRSWTGTAKCLDVSKIDILFVVTGDGSQYCIGASAVGGKQALVLGEKYIAYKVS